MERTYKGLYTTGEFAKLCFVTKDTLFYYEKIRLLKPEITLQNRYRYYSARQFFIMDMIATLKKAGSSLKEIQAYMGEYQKESFLALLKKDHIVLKEQLRELERQMRLLEHSIYITEYAISEPLDRPKLIHCEEEYFIATSIVSESDDDLIQQDAANLHDHIEYCKKIGYRDEYPIGSVIEKEELLGGSIKECYLYSKLENRVEDDRLYIKPAGTYAVILHQNLYEGREEAYRLLLEYIKNAGLIVCGDAYEYEVAGYLSASSPEDFIIQYAVQVTR